MGSLGRAITVIRTVSSALIPQSVIFYPVKVESVSLFSY